ncbi:MAG: HlyD family efflux transporter periplasmic adaptor subunit [Eubacteriales bacterium]|nr:HlyD family efflux transporter periplasmic adaptor subunit [Eubacteriales bacterium]
MTEAEKNQKIKKKKRAKRIKKLIGWLIFLALLAGAFYLFVLPDLTASATTTYDSYTATRGSISNSMSFSGTISVVNSETMTSGSAATVRKIYVSEGESVALGDKLMRLSDGEVFKADFDGEVNEISVEEGDEISANASLIQIVDFSNLQVSVRVDEYSVTDLAVGEACEISVTALDQTFDSTISHINRISSGGNSTAYYTVTAEFSGTENVLPGMQVTVTIPEDEADDVIILNRDALSFTGDNSAFVLMKNEDGDMEQVQVELGVDNDNYVEITSGLSEGDTVYTEVESSASSGSGLASLFSSLTGSSTQSTTSSGGMPSGGNFSGGNMGGGNMGGGGNFGGGGGMP